MRNKRDLDREVALLLGEKQATVSAITTTFLAEIMRRLVEDRLVHIDGFGRFRLVTESKPRPPMVLTTGTLRKGERGPPVQVVVPFRHKVYFSKARPFRKLLHERVIPEVAMEKLGVDENVDQEQLEKASAQGCPQCGGKVERHGNVLSCQTCGTEPFEKGKG